MTDATYHGLEATHPMWIPAAHKAAQQGNAKQLYKPPGFEKCGYSLNYMVRSDHSVRWSLSYRFGHGKYTQIATWLTDWLPLDKVRIAQRPVTPPDKPIRITSEGCDWLARVVLDHTGQPWPVPVTVSV